MTQSAEFKSLKVFAFSMVIVTVVDFVVQAEPPSKKATRHLEEGLRQSLELLKSFMAGTCDMDNVWTQSATITDSVLGEVALARQWAFLAESEPRFTKGPFKSGLFTLLADSIVELQMNITTLVRRGFGSAPGVMQDLTETSSYSLMREDITNLADDLESTVRSVIEYEGFGRMPLEEDFKKVLKQKGVHKVEGLNTVAQDLRGKVKQDEDIISLEDDKACCMCVVLVMLGTINKQMVKMLEVCVDTM